MDNEHSNGWPWFLAALLAVWILAHRGQEATISPKPETTAEDLSRLVAASERNAAHAHLPGEVVEVSPPPPVTSGLVEKALDRLPLERTERLTLKESRSPPGASLEATFHAPRSADAAAFLFRAAAVAPPRPARTPLDGRWSGGDLAFEIRESADGESIDLTCSGTWVTSGRGGGTRRGEGFEGVLTSYFHNDPLSAPRSGRFTLRRLSERTLVLDTEFIYWRMSDGAEVARQPQTATLTRD